VTEEKQDQRIK